MPADDLAARAVSGPAVWTGGDMQNRAEWIVHFSAAERAELERAAENVRRRNIQLDDATRADFDLPQLSPVLEKVRRELARGRGFVMLRGLPVEAYSEDELGTLFWGIGTHLGTGVSQSLAGDRLGHVIDLGGKDRYYTRGGEIEFHMDPVDVVGLMCLRGAKSGGESRIISAMHVYNTILAERPDLMEVLQRGYHYSRRAQDPHGAQRYTPQRVSVFKEGGMGMECYYLPISIRNAATDGAPFDEKDEEAFDFMATVCARPENHLDMEFREGDMQFLNNRTILHARTDYVDHDDPALRRHLLRLWLMMEDWPERPMTMRPHAEADRAGGGIARK